MCKLKDCLECISEEGKEKILFDATIEFCEKHNIVSGDSFLQMRVPTGDSILLMADFIDYVLFFKRKGIKNETLD